MELGEKTMRTSPFCQPHFAFRLEPKFRAVERISAYVRTSGVEADLKMTGDGELVVRISTAGIHTLVVGERLVAAFKEEIPQVGTGDLCSLARHGGRRIAEREEVGSALGSEIYGVGSSLGKNDGTGKLETPASTLQIRAAATGY